MMTPIGKYRWLWAGGLNPLYTWSPFYGHRRQYLPLVKRVMTQILVMVLGTPQWINVDDHDLQFGS